jgi:hypothetical protein
MSNIEKHLITEAVKTRGLSIARLGLRFDRVVIKLAEQLHEFAADAVPTGTTVLLTVAAPILLPARTAVDLAKRIESLLANGSTSQDQTVTVKGNSVRIRILKHSSKRTEKLLLFVHNRTTRSLMLLDLVEEWLD